MDKEIYLDNAATTRCDEQVAQRVLRVLTGDYGNPSSLHAKGFSAERLVGTAARQVAALLRCDPEELVFTSGATEANNLALIGAARARRRRGMRVVSDEMEHASVLGALKALGAEGYDIALCRPSPEGKVLPGDIAGLVDGGTSLLSVMLVNNETGAVNDVAAIAAAARQKNPGVVVHCDAVQAVGKLDINLKKLPVDLLTLSGHKFYGPKGVGALYIRRGTRLLPMLFGGEQQRGVRPGTENVPGIAGLGLACELAGAARGERLSRAGALCARLRAGMAGIPGGAVLSPEDASPYICSVAVAGVRAETLLHFLSQRGIYVSSGSACAKGAKSHVLAALGLPAALTDSALRVSFGAASREEEVDALLAALREGACTLARGAQSKRKEQMP